MLDCFRSVSVLAICPKAPTMDFIEQAIQQADLKLSRTKIENHHYRCEISSPHATIVREIHTNDESTADPELGQLLYHFVLTAQQIYCSDDFADWVEEYEIETDKEQALADYNQLCTDTTELKDLVGEEVYQELQGALAISQAMNNAWPG